MRFAQILFSIFLSISVGHSMTGNGMRPEVRDIVDKRCVVCHGCYTSPCNMKLDSYWGAERGASQQDIYASRAIEAMRPNRIFQDANTVSEWRSQPFDFHSVLEPLQGANSIMQQMLDARQVSPQQEASDLKKFRFRPEYSRTCAKDQEELDLHLKQNGSLAGMPYGTAPLSSYEYQTLSNWLQSGAGPNPHVDLIELQKLTPQASVIGLEFEKFLNRPTLREQLVARYLYEHLFSAHLHFDGTPTREFYRLVRAKNQKGPVEEIATRRPFDPAGDTVFYRLKKVTETIVQKNHAPFLIKAQDLKKWQQQFLAGDWKVNAMPAFGNDGANPFVTFHAIPAEARYRFFLENAYYFIRTFIHGPVCNGQGATNVIRDHFWVLMIDPKHDLLSQNPKFEKRYGALLDLPASRPNTSTLSAYRWRQLIYQLRSAEHYEDLFKGQLTIDKLWNGERENNNAALTVYRHFKSAGVYNGLMGSFPQTVWVMDYSIFERIYYDLVAGFDVFGNSFHKITTRTYMDLLRTESEDMYLNMFPKRDRQKLRREWNSGYGTLKRWLHPYVLRNADVGELTADNHGLKLYKKLNIYQGARVIGGHDSVNKGFVDGLSDEKNGSKSNLDRLNEIMGRVGTYPRYFPEVTILKIDKKDGSSQPFTILANKDRPFANHLFVEIKNPEGDVLNILSGLDVTHVNLFMQVEEADLDSFIKTIKAIDSEKDWKIFLKKYGIGRLQSSFWSMSDWVQTNAVTLHPERGGIIDITRFDYAGPLAK